VQTRPPDLSDTDVATAVARGWALTGCVATYAPLGYGSHHWHVVDSSGARWFASVDLAEVGGSSRRLAALGAAVEAHEAGLSFVVAPLRTVADDVAVPLGDRYALALYPHVDGRSGSFSDALSREETVELVGMLAELHDLPTSSLSLGHESFEIPGRTRLEDSLTRLADVTHWTGAYGERVRQLLTSHPDLVTSALTEHDRLVEAAGPQADRMVLTHGEPHPGNLLRTEDGLRLIDWDTALLAPPERDLWLVDARSDGRASAAYATFAGRRLQPELLARYDLAWSLADVADFVETLRGAPEKTEDTGWSWDALEGTVNDLAGRYA
jgi:spectinomycin phosphotransferase